MTDEQAVQKITVGSVVAGRYEIRSLIGKGGMGEVFLAHDLQTDRDVALKTLHAKYSQSRHAIARFGREVRLARQLNHPGIVKIFDAQKWENTLFYTMEYIEGKSLRAWLQQRRALDLGSAVRVLCLVAEALEHAHRVTIHRDLSPENIMVLRDGTIRLLDFGLAKIDDQYVGLTVVGTNLGKLRYMAPEQERDAAAVDHRADLFSMGVMFFELLTGRSPLPGQKITQVIPGLPASADLFVAKAIARDPNERYADAREFREALLAVYRDAQAAGPIPAGGPPPEKKKSPLARLLRKLRFWKKG